MLKFTKCLTLDSIALALFSVAATLLISDDANHRICWIGCFPFNWTCESESVCFYGDLKRTTSVLLKLRETLFAFSQFFKFFKS